MKQFSMDLNKNTRRPVIRLHDWHQFDVMIDTGALFPVWVDDEETLKDLGAQCIKNEAPFGGFGGKVSGKLYRFEVFQLGELVFPGLTVIAFPLNLPCQMIISATMFSHLIYEIDDENHKLNVTIPDKQSCIRNLVIQDKDGHLTVFCESGE